MIKTWVAVALVGLTTGAGVGTLTVPPTEREREEMRISVFGPNKLEEAEKQRRAICDKTRSAVDQEASRIVALLIVNEISQFDAVVANDKLSQRIIDVNRSYHCGQRF